MHRFRLLLAAALVAAGLSAVPASVEPARAASTITWTACGATELRYLALQCASLLVPLDHSNPGGPKVRLALTRRQHTGSTYKGVMLVNPGGPGSPGRSTAAIGDYVPGGAGTAYDWIGFDPRGVGASTPSLHCRRDHFGPDRPDYRPRRAGIARYWLAKSRNYAAACANTAAKRNFLRHVSTIDTVLDMEAIRVALGESTINFYGYSYGSYLGQVYATRFPARVGRFVLDGVVNPTRVWYASNLDQERGFDRNLRAFFRYLAAHPRAFKLGKRPRAIRAGYYRELRDLRRRPAAAGRLGPSELTDALLDATYYVFDWVEIGQEYSALKRRNRGGALYRRYLSENAGDDNGYAMYNATQCTDAPWPGWSQTGRDARAVHRAAPYYTWANTWYNGPCLTWATRGSPRQAVSGGSLTGKILLITESQDAATPASGALVVRRLFPSASLVVGLGGTTHSSSLSGVPCVDNTVAAYLRNGTVPARQSGNRADRYCPRLAPPRPYVAGGRVTSQLTDPMSPLLRQDLRAAQRPRG